MFLKMFKDSQGNNVITQYIHSLNRQEEKARLIALLTKIDTGGAKYLADNHELNTKKLVKGLFEIKVSKHRFLYCYHDGNEVYIVHSFMKKTQKTPKKDLKLAISRIEQIKAQE